MNVSRVAQAWTTKAKWLTQNSSESKEIFDDGKSEGASEPSPFPLIYRYKAVRSALTAAFSGALVATTALSTVACAPASNVSSQPMLSSDGTGIIGGTDATGTEPFAKHIIGLYDLSIGALCTASLLSDSIAVTAAHCVESAASDLRVVFGTDFSSSTLIVRAVTSYKVSPLWAFRQGQEFNNGDIAVIHFSGGLPAGFTPIKFLTDVSQLKDGAAVMLAGYGASTVVQVKDPKTGQVSSDHQNSGKLRYVSTTIKQAAYSKSEILMEQALGKGACHGDSGGPAYIDVGGDLVLIGVTSRGVNDPKDTCGVSAAYTSVVYYSNWIRRTAKALVAAAANPRPVAAGVAAGVPAPRPGT